MATGALAIPPGAVVGLPIFLFMFIVAVSQPGLGAWSERRGRRPAFLLAAALAVAAHLLSAQAASLAGLLAWRAAAGLAWAGAFVAAQGMVLAYTDQSSRAKGLAGFVAVVLVSLACGPALGGLLADALGYRATFLLAALLAAAALLLAWRTLPRAAPAPAPGAATARPAGVGALPLHPLRNWRFLGLLLLAAVPAKLILVAFCYYLMPLYLAAAGYSAAMAGRVIMVYSVVMVLLLPLGADAFERLRRRRRITPHAWFVGAGVACSGLAGGAMLLPSEIMAATVLAGVLGAAQALSISAQAAMVPQLARREIARHGEAVVYGYYRLVERIGSALGPLVAGAMLQLLGFRLSFLALGGVVFACGLLFALLFARPSQLTAAPAPAVAP
jgi:predicted MFS family arabinose efflux permease